ncbi:MAG TPA: tetratricopeptide repeat protein [Rectinemataceae bacterium]|nr:tetratricopeptide repeat protein [Rectinemataceae bacterium]
MEQSVLVIPDKAKLSALYADSKPRYEEALSSFLSMVESVLSSHSLKPTLKGRVKEFDSYYAKKLRLLKKAWTEKAGPLPVNDVIAIRVICPFLGDLAKAEKILSERFSVEEIERKGAERSFREFGYESIHLLVRIPEEIIALCPHIERHVIEIQLRTILQEAWAEVEHELVYKAEFTPFDEPMRRKLAALNANLTLSDIIFQEILEFEKRLNAELGHRRNVFYRKIEEVADAPEIGTEPETKNEAQPPADAASGAQLGNTRSGGSLPEEKLFDGSMDKSGDMEGYGSFGMDGLLLAALEAHNKADFDRAVRIYSMIVAEKPDREIASVVYKHRGMAYFAQSRYHEALQDFSSCLTLDPECYKALYYRGVVKSVLEDFLGAAEDFSAALQIHPYHFFSRYRRALCYFKMGDTATAHADCEIALRIEPENALALHLFAKIKEKLALEDF